MNVGERRGHFTDVIKYNKILLNYLRRGEVRSKEEESNNDKKRKRNR